MIQIQQLTANPVEEAALFLTAALVAQLKGNKRVLFLVSGGSALHVYQKMGQLWPKDVDLSGLKLGLVDERFVPMGDKDSNEQQLREAGVVKWFEEQGATFFGVLHSLKKKSGQELALQANEKYFQVLSETDVSIISLGMGDDGHTAGILPMQSGPGFMQMFNGEELVTFYEVQEQDSANPFRQRITITLPMIREADLVMLYATGEKKRAALAELLQEKLLNPKFPVSVLQERQKPTIVLTDLQLT